jgi:hypothetical protein
MEKITLVVKYQYIKEEQGKLKRSRLVWKGAGIEIYVLGPLSGHLFNEAGYVAQMSCEKRHIPVSSLRVAK